MNLLHTPARLRRAGDDIIVLPRPGAEERLTSNNCLDQIVGETIPTD